MEGEAIKEVGDNEDFEIDVQQKDPETDALIGKIL